MKREIDTDRFPEWQPFLDAVQQRGPHAGTWCEAWTVRVAWTGRTMKAPWFAEHMREELVLHGWDITSDDAAAQARLRVAGADDVVVDVDADGTTIRLADPDGPATLETDAAARVLLLWGRRPADPSRICSRVGPETLGRVRSLLAGY